MASSLPEGFQIDMSVEAGNWPPEEALDALLQRAVSAVFACANFKVVSGAEVSVLFTDDASIRKLNRQWRDKDKPTNVLSFPGSDPQDDVYGPMLGDIVFARETIDREVEEFGIEFDNYISHLTVHGLLHLFDYDHQEDEEAEVMESLEKTILASMGIDDPYADRPLVGDSE